MKRKMFLLLAIIATMWQTASAGQDSDTVWTKNIWPEEVSGVLFSPDGSQVYVSTNNRVWILNTLTGDSIRTVYGTGSFKYFSKDGRFIYTFAMKKLDAQTFDIMANYDTIPTDGFNITDMALSGDGSQLYVVSSYGHVDSVPSYFFKDNLAIFNTDNMHFEKMISYPERFYNIASSDDGRFFVTMSGSCDNWYQMKNCKYKLEIWDSKTYLPVKTIYLDTIPPGTIKFTPDSKYLAAAIRGQVLFYETINFTIAKKFGDYTTAMAFTDDSKFMITGGSSTLIWDLEQYNLYYKYNKELPWGRNGVEKTFDKKYIISASAFMLALFNGKFDNIGILENPLDKETIIIFPNPIDGNATITINSSIPGNISINIFDVRGMKLLNLFSGFAPEGKREFLWNTTGYPSGIYFCKITGDKVTLTYKIIITK